MNRRTPFLRNFIGVIAAFTPFVILILWARSNNVLYSDNCSPASVPLSQWPGKHVSVECQSLPLSADWPSLMLALTSSLSNLTLFLSFCRVRSLEQDLQSDGLLESRTRIASDHHATLDRLGELPSKLKSVIVFSVVLVAAGTLYWATYTHAAYINVLSDVQRGRRGQPFGNVAFDVLRQGWWANFRVHPAGAVLWLFIGALGTGTAILQMLTSLQTFNVTKKMGNLGLLRIVDDFYRLDHGWAALDKIVTLKLFGLLTFVPAYAALILILWVPVWEALLLFIVAASVLCVTWLNLRFSTKEMPRIQRQIVGREIDVLTDRLENLGTTRSSSISTPAYLESRFIRIELLLERASLLRAIEVPKNRVLRVLIATLVGSITLVGLIASLEQLFTASLTAGSS